MNNRVIGKMTSDDQKQALREARQAVRKASMNLRETEIAMRQEEARRWRRRGPGLEFDAEQASELRQKALEFRNAHGLTQAEMSDHCDMSAKRYTNFEQDKGHTTLATYHAVQRGLDIGLGKKAPNMNQDISVLRGPDGAKAKAVMHPLTRESLFLASDQLIELKPPLVFTVSNAIVWVKEGDIKKQVGAFENQLNGLMKYQDPPTTDQGFMSVIEHAETRQKVRREFAESVPSDLLGRLYGAFVNARIFNEENEPVDASVFYIVLGAGVGEEWSVQFSRPLDPEAVDQARDFSKRWLDTN